MNSIYTISRARHSTFGCIDSMKQQDNGWSCQQRQPLAVKRKHVRRTLLLSQFDVRTSTLLKTPQTRAGQWLAAKASVGLWIKGRSGRLISVQRASRLLGLRMIGLGCDLKGLPYSSRLRAVQCNECMHALVVLIHISNTSVFLSIHVPFIVTRDVKKLMGSMHCNEAGRA